MRAEILSIGTELLLGQIVDTNAAWLAGRLADLGIDCYWISTVGDNLGRATDAVARALARSDVVVCTGGLGPTEDDLTREAIAGALGEEPRVDDALAAELRGWFGRRGLEMPERNRKQAWLIPSARPLANPLGTAPGWIVKTRHPAPGGAERILVAMPGVPREMTRMWEREVEPLLRTSAPIRSRTLKLLGIGESTVEEELGALVHSTAPTVATYAKTDGVHVRITDRDADAVARDRRIEAMEAQVRVRVGAHVWGVDDETLASVIGRRLMERGRRLATAEAVTGGELARALSEAEDAARWCAGGIVLPGADETRLRAAVEPLGAEVEVLVPDSADIGVVIVRRPEGEERASFRFASPADARRRGLLAALDLLRRTA
ncbi:MAG: CinA family nicotinamide mononucleotide deamidase-related protein [Chloroflexota bacterium]|nr:CinA family nicotinamide mononucleotide deamidase-related protein [Chloroflexota bacterium]